MLLTCLSLLVSLQKLIRDTCLKILLYTKSKIRAVARLQNKTRQVLSAEGASHLGGLGHASQKILKPKGSEMLFSAFSVAFFFRKVSLGQNQDEAIASSCLMLATARPFCRIYLVPMHNKYDNKYYYASDSVSKI